MDTSFYNQLEMVGLAVHLAMDANHTDRKAMFNGEEIVVKRGQLIIGRKSLAKQFSMPESTIWRKLQLLKNVGFLDIKTNNRYSIITIINYEHYQGEVEKRTAKWTEVGQQMDNKRTHLNNDKNENNTNEQGSEAKKLLDYFHIKYKEKTSKAYIPNYAKDMILLKALLKTVTFAEVHTLIGKFFNTSDAFVLKNGYTVAIFKSQVNKLNNEEVSEVHPMREL